MTAHKDNEIKIPAGFYQMCETLLNLPSSSAGIERGFSTMKNTITDKRNRLSVDKAKKITFIRDQLKADYIK
jgi:hAT family protein